jgi:hypothetical protein
VALNTIAVQRQAHDGKANVEVEKLRSHVKTLDGIAAEATNRHRAFMDYGTDGTQNVDQLAGHFKDLAELYKQAYANYSGKMKEAGENAALADSFRDAVIGVAIGVAVGLLMPEVAAGAGTMVVLKQETQGELLELGIGKFISAVTDIKKAALNQLKQATILIEMYRNIGQAVSGAGLFFDTALAAKDLIASIKGFAAGEREKTAAKIESQIAALTDFAPKGQSATDAVAKARAAIARKAAEAATDAGEASMAEMEKEIWVRHIANLSARETEKLLDNHTVQTYLFQTGVLGPDSRLDTSMEQWLGWVPFLNELDPSVSKRANQMAFDQTAAMDVVGKEGTASNDIESSAGDGLAKVEGRAWDAIAGRGQSIKRGEQIRVIRTQLLGDRLHKRVALTVVRIEG